MPNKWDHALVICCSFRCPRLLCSIRYRFKEEQNIHALAIIVALKMHAQHSWKENRADYLFISPSRLFALMLAFGLRRKTLFVKRE
jgi:hypothetical protein